jgi:hypothetical protein
MRKWLRRNLAALNILLSVLSIIGYMALVDALVFWTNWGGQIGEIGGVLDYQPYGLSSIYHVTSNNTRGRLLFTFPDFPLYTLTAIACLNIVALLPTRANKPESPDSYPRRLAIGSAALSVVCMVLYVWGTMMYIDGALKFDGQIGGSVYYMPPFYIWVTHVYNGHIESFPNWRALDTLPWITMLLIILALYYIRSQLANND